MPIAIHDNLVVTIHYTLTNDAGEILDQSAPDTPLSYLQGAGNIIPGLEQALQGKVSGEQMAVTIAPEDAYGPHQEHLVQQVPRTAFPEDITLAQGMEFSAQSEQGPVRVVITDIAGEQITIDANHPLAGETLHFDVTIADVRPATEEEIAHGHVH